jgi:peptide/nickel transport system substrate-binding protein
MPRKTGPHLTTRLLALLAALAIFTIATAQTPNYDPNGSLTFVTNADPTLNPWTPGAVIESNLVNTILFDQLTRYSTKDLTPSPDLATSWEAAPDALSWTFHLRQGVKWSDGKPFGAADVAFTFNKVILNKALGANNSSVFSPVDHVEVVDPNTVRFVLKSPFSSLPYYLAYFAGMLPAHVLESAPNPLQVASFNKSNPVVTGPFKVAEFVPGSYVRLEPNPDYWGQAPKVKTIVFKVVADPNTQLAQLLAGDVDMVTVTNPTLLAGVERNPNLEVLRQSQNIWYWVALNQSDPRFTDVRVRQALLTAIDRQAIIDSVLKGYGTVATGPIAPLQKAFYDGSVPSYPYDPARAKQLMADAGWTPGPDGILQKDGKKLTITVPTGQFGYLVNATLLVQQYWKAIGVDAKLNVMEWNAYIQDVVVKRNYQATLAWWSTPPTPDITPYFSTAAAEKGNNIPNYKNAELDALMAKARAATNVDDEVTVVKAIEANVAQNLPYLFLWYPDIITVLNKKVGGMATINTPTAFQYSADWYVKR